MKLLDGFMLEQMDQLSARSLAREAAAKSVCPPHLKEQSHSSIRIQIRPDRGSYRASRDTARTGGSVIVITYQSSRRPEIEITCTRLDMELSRALGFRS
jgi:starvation-inducible outer membrane lipoprotein